MAVITIHFALREGMDRFTVQAPKLPLFKGQQSISAASLRSQVIVPVHILGTDHNYTIPKIKFLVPDK